MNMPSPNTPRNTLAIYVHWPFCKSKCPYCDFNSHVAATIDHTAWLNAYKRELGYYAALLPDRRITSIFFGGGTPSLMLPDTVAGIIDTIARLWYVDENVEITLEANPTSSEAGRFAGFRQAGVNRLSLGVQALNDVDLKFLGREHSAAEAKKAIELARTHFPRFSFDLIYARRDQTLATWEPELREAIALANGHLSLYQLTIEPSTLFYTRSQRGETLTAPDEASAVMFEATQQILSDAGLPAYEISNHAHPGNKSRHNLTYWHYEDYIGIGPGAHGRYVADERYATDNHRAPDMWLRQVAENGVGVRQREVLDIPTAMREALMMGLRLTEGIDKTRWFKKFGTSLDAFLAEQKIARLIDEHYITSTPTAMTATTTGRQRLNAIIGYLND